MPYVLLHTGRHVATCAMALSPMFSVMSAGLSRPVQEAYNLQGEVRERGLGGKLPLNITNEGARCQCETRSGWVIMDFLDLVLSAMDHLLLLIWQPSVTVVHVRK